MSLNRRKNIYTLGDFHHQQPQKALSRRQNPDPFERDPFKIQSYKFHYADRPIFPLRDLGNRSQPQQTSTSSRSATGAPKRFETFYYNHDFAPTRNGKENNATNKFHEFRRRKFLYDHQQTAPVPHHPTVVSNQQYQQSRPIYSTTQQQLLTQYSRPNFGQGAMSASSCELPTTSNNAYGASNSGQNMSGLRTLHAINANATNNSDSDSGLKGNGQQSQQQQQQQRQFSLNAASSKISVASCGSAPGFRRQSNDIKNSSYTEKFNSSCTRLSTSQLNRKLQTLHVPSKHELNGRSDIERQPSTCSGCHISINIQGADEKQLGENVTINIETDPCKKYINFLRAQQQQRTPQPQQQQQERQKQQKSPQRSQLLKDQEINNNLTKVNTKPLQDIKKPLLNLSRCGSSNSIIVEKSNSKMSIVSNTFRPVKRPEPRSAIDFKPISPFVVPNRSSPDRLPSIVPLNVDKLRRELNNKENKSALTALNEVRLATERPLQQMRSSRNTFNLACNDLKVLTNYEKLLRARAAAGPLCSAATSTSHTQPIRSQPMKPDHKLMNIPALANRKYEVIMAQSYEPQRRKRLDSLSRLSLRSHTEKCSCSRNTVANCRSSETQFSNARLSSMHQHSYNRRSLSPVSVNINVYAEKLRLLRV